VFLKLVNANIILLVAVYNFLYKDRFVHINLTGSIDNVLLRGMNYLEKLGFPGCFPYTRGIYQDMYKGKLWTMRQYSGFATAEETNQRYKLLIQRGQSGLSVAFDLPTQMGYDSDQDPALAEVGKTGVPISTIQDMEILFNDIALDKVSVSMTINATAPIILAMYIAIAEKKGIPPNLLSGTIQNDILKEFIARGCYIYPPHASLKLVIDIFEYCLKNMPRWNFISISGYHIREAGATASQELGFTLANAIWYLNEAQKRGLDLVKVAQRISFFFGIGSNFFEEIAKLRAGRRLWARIIRDRFSITDPRAQILRVHCQTAGSTLTYQQPQNNIVRVTYQALAAVLGGVQSLHTNAMDEALSLPTERSATIALRTQQIIAYESGVADIVDPLGGSFYLEELTDKLEEEAENYIKQVENLGGAIRAIENGYYMAQIEKSAFDYQKRLEEGQAIVVGVNKFVEDEKPAHVEYTRIDESTQKVQIDRVKNFKKNRNPSKVQESLMKFKKFLDHDENLIPYLIELVKSGITLGEINNLLMGKFGCYK
jgi:methylmalonyl-CoA mutase N-terminal domain/subunit